jgi:hypothetical protein
MSLPSRSGKNFTDYNTVIGKKWEGFKRLATEMISMHRTRWQKRLDQIVPRFSFSLLTITHSNQ